MTSAYSINLNFNNTIPVKTDFTFKQGDKGITLNFTTTGLDTTGTTAKIVFKRSNGTSVEADLVGAGPTYSYTILGNEFEIPGMVVADLKLYNGDTQRVSTASFIFLVTGDTMDGVGGGTGGYSDQLEELSQEFSDTLEEYKDAFGDVGAVNPRGAYDSTADYNVLDLVSYQGSSYLCRTACKNKVPTNTTYWQVFASGAQGVDYDDLTGKPSINSVTLSGDKTTADLGLFSGNYNDLTNKPTIPSDFDDLADVDMTGVTDGQVPTWDATAGKYKPGTPAGSGGGTNPNLLINPWFTINQRTFSENTSSNNNTYCFDRWITICSGAGKVQADSNGIKMLPSSSVLGEYASIAYRMEDAFFEQLKNKTLTASVLLSDGTLISATAETGSISSSVVFKAYSADSPISIEIDTSKRFRIIAYTTTIIIRAVKLEIGSTSTLHLDTAPDYTTELLKCQRYFRRWGSNIGTTNLSIGYAEQTTEARFIIALPVPMRAIPSITTLGTLKMTSGGTDISISSITLHSQSSVDFLTLKCACAGGMTVGSFVKLYTYASSAYIDFSSEL